jgi:hypothetical protein
LLIENINLFLCYSKVLIDLLLFISKNKTKNKKMKKL